MSNIVKYNTPNNRYPKNRNPKVSSPPINNNSMANIMKLSKVDNSVYAYLNIGNKEDRNIVGKVTRVVELRNSDNQVIKVSEVHNFANGRKGTTIKMKGTKSSNANRRKY